MSAILLLLASLTAIFAADPVPPCYNPIVPDFESMCSETVFTSGDISIKQYGLPKTETLVVGQVSGNQFYVDALPVGIQYIINYFAGNNDERRSILNARTVPITVRPPTPGVRTTWTFAMMASTALFPNPILLPTPLLPTQPLATFGSHLFAVIKFKTDIRPYDKDFILACDNLIAALPPQYTVLNTSQSSWTPTWALYNNQSTTANFTNECWLEVASKLEA